LALNSWFKKTPPPPPPTNMFIFVSQELSNLAILGKNILEFFLTSQFFWGKKRGKNRENSRKI
jgi:hypothetical protein